MSRGGLTCLACNIGAAMVRRGCAVTVGWMRRYWRRGEYRYGRARHVPATIAVNIARCWRMSVLVALCVGQSRPRRGKWAARNMSTLAVRKS